MPVNRHLVAIGTIVALHGAFFWALRDGWVTDKAPSVTKTLVARLLLADSPPAAKPPALNKAAPAARQTPPPATVTPPSPKVTSPKLAAARPATLAPVATAPAPNAITLPDAAPRRADPEPVTPAPTLDTAIPPVPSPMPIPTAALPATDRELTRAAAPSTAPAIKTLTAGVQYLKPPEPVYPPISRRHGEQGRVVLRVLVGTDGEPERIEVHRSSGYPKLDGAAREAARQSRFKPYVEDGKATPVWALIPIHFALES